MKRPCKNCPFKRDMYWIGGVNRKLLALDKIERQKIFSCHMANTINVHSDEDMVNDDCVGFKQMKENMSSPNSHPKIVNHFNETAPTWDLTNIDPDWANSEFLRPLNYKTVN